MAEQQNSMFQQKYQMIINQASVREVMEEYGLKIVKKGKDFKTVCPFHDDHDPSLSIRDDKIWKCFVCNESGNAISFVQKYENKVLGNRGFTVRDAMNKVIDICHLNIPKEQNNQNSLNAQYSHNSRIYTEHERVLLNTLNKIKEIANYNLISLGNTEAKQYLLNRGFTEDLIQELQFGYISYEQIQQWIDKTFLPLEHLLETGFIRQDEEGNYYPVFGNRILIPVMDERGNTVTFSGRAIHGEEPKYLHGRNTEIFMKSNHLYNFNIAKNYAYNDKIYVVEGFMDVAGGNKMNIRNIVATMGTSFSEEQIAMLRRLDCEIILMRDNDKAGRNAMVKEIPELMSKKLKVSVVDLNTVKENLQLAEDKDSKDLWDFANAGAVEQDLEKARVSGFQYLMKNQYFLGKDFNTETIRDAYDEAKKDELIKTSYDEMNFKDYVAKHSTYSKEEVDDIIHSLSLEEKTNPIFQFQVNLMERYIISNSNTYVNRTGDKTMVEFYQKNYDRLRQNILNRFHEDPTRYLSPELDKVLIPALVQDTMVNDELWLRYETIHKFKHENVFNKTFVKNTIGQQAQMKLDMEQKRLVVKQFEKTFTDDEKLEFEHIDELYIVNKYQELSGIIDIEGSDNAKFLLEALEMKWIGKKEGMSVFSYSSIFDKSMLFAIDPKYKTADGKDFKSILLYNNSGGSLKLTKNNIATPQKSNGKQEVEQSIQKEKTVSKERTFTVHHNLITRETDDSYFVRIPNTMAKKYMYIPKKDTQWSANREILVATVSTKDTFAIYRSDGQQQETWNCNDLMKRWEDKTKKKESIDINLAMNKNLQSTPVKRKQQGNPIMKKKLDIPSRSTEMVQKFQKYRIPVHLILNNEKGTLMVRSAMQGYTLFIPKTSVRYVEGRSYIEVTPEVMGIDKFKTISTISVGKDVSDGMELKGNISFNELDMFLSSEGKKVWAVVDENKLVEQSNGFVQIRIFKDRTYGYVRVNKKELERINDNQIALVSTPYHEYSAYKKSGEFNGLVCAKDIDYLYNESTKGSIDIDNMEATEELEKEVKSYE